MALATWWIGDQLIELNPLPDFRVRLSEDDRLVAQLNQITIEEVQTRKRAGHRSYLGYLGQQAVTYGWVATRTASIGELDLLFPIPTDERYLWDFATIPQ